MGGGIGVLASRFAVSTACQLGFSHFATNKLKGALKAKKKLASVTRIVGAETTALYRWTGWCLPIELCTQARSAQWATRREELADGEGASRMLCFVMALKSPTASVDWSTVQKVFEQTLTSVCNQNDPDFQVIVVCNEKPALRRATHRSVHFLVKDLPSPDIHVSNATMNDKWDKLAHGLVLAREFRPDFVMLMDADDLVSRRLAAHANCNKGQNGWIFKNGYRWLNDSRWLEYTNTFNCGTNSIVNCRLIKYPKDLSEESKQECIVLKSGHTRIEKAMQDQGTPLEPLPFPGAVWVYGHGDNDSTLRAADHQSWHSLRFSLGSIRRRRYISPWYKQEFGLVDSTWSRVG